MGPGSGNGPSSGPGPHPGPPGSPMQSPGPRPMMIRPQQMQVGRTTSYFSILYYLALNILF